MSEVFKIQSIDGQVFHITRDAVRLADYLNTLCDITNDEAIDFPEANGKVVGKLVEFLEVAKQNLLPRISRPLKNQGDLAASGVEPWALAFLENLFADKDTGAAWKLVFDLLNLADFVNAPSLVKLLSAKIASRIAAMDMETKGIVFKPSRGLTEEEIAAIKEKHAWAMEDAPGED